MSSRPKRTLYIELKEASPSGLQEGRNRDIAIVSLNLSHLPIDEVKINLLLNLS